VLDGDEAWLEPAAVAVAAVLAAVVAVGVVSGGGTAGGGGTVVGTAVPGGLAGTVVAPVWPGTADPPVGVAPGEDGSVAVPVRPGVPGPVVRSTSSWPGPGGRSAMGGTGTPNTDSTTSSR